MDTHWLVSCSVGLADSISLGVGYFDRLPRGSPLGSSLHRPLDQGRCRHTSPLKGCSWLLPQQSVLLQIPAARPLCTSRTKNDPSLCHSVSSHLILRNFSCMPCSSIDQCSRSIDQSQHSSSLLTPVPKHRAAVSNLVPFFLNFPSIIF